MIVRVIDFESTGLPPEASVCEAAFVDLHDADTDPKIGPSWQSLVVPTTEMSVEALATHHITAEAATKHGIEWGEAQLILKDRSPVYTAHNANFEKEFFNPEGSRWIDTYKVALRLWPDAPKHTNQALRYYLVLGLDDRAMPPHRALPDAWVTTHILIECLNHASVEDMIAWSGEPPFLTTMPFGKHYGERFSDVPRGYLEWILRQPDMDEGVVAAAKRELAQ